jgi:hypothetical protein
MAEHHAEQQDQQQQEAQDDEAYLHFCLTELKPHLSPELYRQVEQALGY